MTTWPMTKIRRTLADVLRHRATFCNAYVRGAIFMAYVAGAISENQLYLLQHWTRCKR